VPTLLCRKSSASRLRLSRSSNNQSACGNSSSASGVGTRRPFTRSNRRKPSSSSGWRTIWLSAGCEIERLGGAGHGGRPHHGDIAPPIRFAYIPAPNGDWTEPRLAPPNPEMPDAALATGFSVRVRGLARAFPRSEGRARDAQPGLLVQSSPRRRTTCTQRRPPAQMVDPRGVFGGRCRARLEVDRRVSRGTAKMGSTRGGPIPCQTP
jgi:hypothetical protein